ncbi:MAG: NAD-dependent DNA ligase LigA [Bacteroidetes bacterium]|nr:NAD-dependent DNA ligase LigA [Bacteroidota bacterium]
MYTASQKNNLLATAKEFALRELGVDDIETLKEILNFADWTYYVQDDPLLADVEYDTLFAKLKKIESHHPELITPDSPTQRVAKGLNTEFTTVNHLVPMLSLENSYDAEDLIDWDRKCRELSGDENIEYCIEPKFDGASISLIYENDNFQRGATRGDGVQGDDITTNTKQIRSIPLSAKLSASNIKQIEIRGEVLLTKEKFKIYNDKLIADGLAPLANPRNAASGSLRIKDSTEVAKRGLDAFLYHVSNFTLIENVVVPEVMKTHYGSLHYLEQLGFKTSIQHAKVVQGISNIIDICSEFEAKRDELPYEIDGMVIKVNRLALQEKIGQTSHHPRWAIAFKFKARQATSKLLQVEYQVGRTGSITPVAKIEPVYVGGVTISSLSLFNDEVIKEKNLMLGDTVLIERAGDVIPYVVKSFPELRDGSEHEIVFPTHCPVCNETLYKPEAEAVWRCTNINCTAQIIERLAHYASKDAMDIRGLGDALVKKFFESGYLHHISSIYHLPYEQMKGLEGFGEKSMQNLQAAIEKSKSQPLHRLLFALGIRFVGETTAKTLARNISHIRDLYTMNIEQLCTYEDVGIKVAGAIVDFFSHPDNIHLIDELEASGVNLQNNMKQVIHGGELSGKTFLFTGTLSMKRSDAEAQVEAKGGSIIGSVSTKLNYLVVGEDAGSKLEKAKKLGTIHILSEQEFLDMMG